ncbi:hypothetical protein AcV5_005231 [Taiwanofungus camphoratus]|nr:hypothetical protein AcV5_005231 [Antrodia cinnamomea]
MLTVVEVLVVAGASGIIPLVYRLVNFVWLYFFRLSSVHNYIHGSSAYALVTGASDGIGKAVAQELYQKGFNLILHGHNEDKMRKAVEEIRAGGLRDVRFFLADATISDHDFADMMEPYKGLNITVVIHNVGGTFVRLDKIDKMNDSDILRVVCWNVTFPLLLTRTLLPTLRSSAKTGPVMVQFVGSRAGDVSPPRLAVYSGSKAFLHALSRGLDTDERVWGTPSGVRFAYLVLGLVSTNSMRTKATLMCPSSKSFAKALVEKIGYGRRRYTPWMPHAVMEWVMGMVGERAVNALLARIMEPILSTQGKDK